MEGGEYNGAAIQVTTNVSEVTNARRVFKVDRAEVDDSYIENVFRHGTVEFTSGNCDGLEFTIESNTEATAEGDSEITLFIDAPYDLAVDDTCALTVGCDKTISTCMGKFANYLNFGGFPDVPGADRAIFIPDRV